MPLHVSSTCANHQEVKIALHCLWYHHTETSEWSNITKIQFYKYEQILVKFMCEYFGCDYCVLLCSKHVEAWNKLIVKQKFCASIWLIAEINILRYTVSKTSKLGSVFLNLFGPWPAGCFSSLSKQLEMAWSVKSKSESL